MKLSAQQVERFLRQPSVPAVLVYGPDQGLVRERVERLIGAVLDDPKDPFRLSELSADALRGDPGRLLDEARALCLAGGRRVVRLRQAGDQVDGRLPRAARARAARGPGRDRRRRARPGLLAAAADRRRRQCRRDRVLPRRGAGSRRADRSRCWPSTTSRSSPRRGPIWSSIWAPIAASRAANWRSSRSISTPRARSTRRAASRSRPPPRSSATARRSTSTTWSMPRPWARRPGRALPRPPARRGSGPGPAAARAGQPPQPTASARLPGRGRRVDRPGDRARAAAGPLPAPRQRQGRAAAVAGGESGGALSQPARRRDRLQDHRLAGGRLVPASGARRLPRSREQRAAAQPDRPHRRTARCLLHWLPTLLRSARLRGGAAPDASPALRV